MLSIVKNRTLVEIIKAKTIDYGQLVKVKLTLLVVFSAAMGFLVADMVAINQSKLVLLVISGFLITGSANGINQIIERYTDQLMSRTLNRPVATGRLSVFEASVVVLIMGVLGALLLAIYVNGISAIIGSLSLLIYSFVYTPMKRKSAWAVFAGAFPGAAPTVIGYTAVTGELDLLCLLIFGIQFIWQFPHFWAVAWMLNDDYNKAGFFLLPTKLGRTKKSAIYIVATAFLLVPLCFYLTF